MLTPLLLGLALFGVDREPRKMPPPEYISPKMREELRTFMHLHGRAAMALTMGVVLLAHDEVAEIACSIAQREGVPRPLTGERGTLSAALPDRYFDYQEELRLSADALASAAASKNNRKMHAAFSRVTQTCMGCHEIYLDGPGSRDEGWPFEPAP